jgi:transcriptional regulator with XRE-family HTH domain
VSTAPPWERPGYSEIVASSIGRGSLNVSFANGDTVVIPTALVGLGADVSNVRVDPSDPLAVYANTDEGEIELGWMQLRIASDPSYAQEMRRRDAEESRRIGLRLKALREDKGIRQIDLARLAQMPAPQLAKIESGALDMRMSTIRTLLRAMDATFADISNETAPELSLKAIRRRLEAVGLPRNVATQLLGSVDRNLVPALLERALQWSTRDGLTASAAAAWRLAPQFKAHKHEVALDSPVLHLAYAVSRIVSDAFTTSYQPLPSDSARIRAEVSGGDEQVTLEKLLDWTWRRGIAVIPLDASGGFAAAAWAVGAGRTIVLKDARDLVSFWLFDLAHELGHVAKGHVDLSGIVDVDPPTLADKDMQEQEANEFALELLVPNHVELVARVRAISRPEAPNSRLRFKGAVETVAHEAGISPGLLGMIAAYELSDVAEPKDRWGSATNLDKPLGSARKRAQEALRAHVDSGALPALDRALLEAVVLNEDEE